MGTPFIASSISCQEKLQNISLTLSFSNAHKTSARVISKPLKFFLLPIGWVEEALSWAVGN